ncbi:MAG TPA: sigma-70 family RNA polymerase sigma factor [Niabella sp.]|nr:sigma-70 family RNA polymerase sigma factor [Niabella sp.]
MNPNRDDTELISLFREGDIASFELLMKKYEERAFIIANKLTRNREISKEVVQDSFLKVYKGLKKFNGSSKFSTWLYRIIYNTALDYRRKEDKWNKKKSSYSDKTNLNEEHESQFDLNFLHKEILSAIQKLNPRDGLIVTLFYLHELSIIEIAQIMGVSSEYVKINLFRSRVKLKGILNHLKIRSNEN